VTPRANARLAVALLMLAAAFLAASCGGQSSKSHLIGHRATVWPAGHGSGTASGRPNIVFVLTDDLSMNLLRFMPHVRAMERNGLTFKQYFVSDSLCCPSRASIFTGNFPHDTRVFGNAGPNAGFQTFYKRGEERHTFAEALQRAGYVTAMMGKYLNGYMQTRHRFAFLARTNVPATYVPPGWNEWDVTGWGYPEFHYTLNEDGILHRFGRRRSDYLTDVMSRKGIAFIKHAVASGRPFFLELATFAPHAPYVPAPRNVHDFPGLRAPRPASFDVLPAHAPRWLAGHPPLNDKQLRRIDAAFRRRAQSVEAVDRMIGRIERTLRADGLTRNTYIFFSSDNGLHTGEYRLMPGKLTAFDTDIHVPLVVVGPHVPRHKATGAMSENIDLAETFAAIGGSSLSADGHSLMPLLTGKRPTDWRNAVLIEHRGPRLSIFDPDFQRRASGNPTTYEAMRTHAFLYVEYADGEREFYDLRRDPFELDNIAGRLSRHALARLHAELQALKHCHGGEACWRAMHVESPSHSGIP
jgi:arylsulfatase A-like enzyme